MGCESTELHRQLSIVTSHVEKVAPEEGLASYQRTGLANGKGGEEACFWSKAREALRRSKSNRHWLLLCLSALGMFVGFISASLLMRFYYSQGGSRRWLCGWVQTAGWPACALAMLVVYLRTSNAALAPYNLKTSAAFVFIGCIIAIDNFLYSWGMSYLPASTAGLLTSSQLAFNSLFALFILRKRISPYVWNSIVLVSCSAVILGLHSDSDKLRGVSHDQTVLGYIMTITAAALYGLILSLSELVFTKLLGGRSSLLVLQMQTSTAVVATVVSTVGMAINNDFQAMHHEFVSFRAGRAMYLMTLFWSTLAWQAAFLGTMGVIFLSSSLLAGVILTVVIPVGAIFAFIFFHDAFGGLKVMALLLSLWGFISYIYGGYLESSACAAKEDVGKEDQHYDLAMPRHQAEP